MQSGVTADPDNDDDLESLGGMFYQPLLIFYRSPKPLQRLSELASQRIAIGPEGSGTRFLALALLKANGIEPGGLTTLTSLEGEAARTALVRKQVDAIFLTGDSASAATLREMIHTDGIRLFEFPQADAYVRRFAYLSKLTLPAGAFDLGANLPPENMSLLAPTVELVAHSNLHPALTDLLIEAATQVHGRASLLQTAGQFPNPSIHTFPHQLGGGAVLQRRRSEFHLPLPAVLAGEPGQPVVDCHRAVVCDHRTEPALSAVAVSLADRLPDPSSVRRVDGARAADVGNLVGGAAQGAARPAGDH